MGVSTWRMGKRRTGSQMRLWRAAGLAAVVAMVAASCGGGSSSDDSLVAGVPAGGSAAGVSEVPLGSEIPEEWRDVVEGVVAAGDGDDVSGAIALLSAADRGYDVTVLIDAAADRRLTGDGAVVDDDGNLVMPAGEDGGIITDKAPLEFDGQAAGGGIQLVSFAQAPEEITTEGLRSELEFLKTRDRNSNMAGLIVLLVRAGYSADQIITGIFFGERDLGCSTEVDDRGSFDEVCRFAGEDPEFPEVQRLKSSGASTTTATAGAIVESEDSVVPDEPAGEPGVIGLADGIYSGPFDYDYALFWSIAPDNLHDSRDDVEENKAELEVRDGMFYVLSGAVLTNFPEALQPGTDVLNCGTNTAFDLTGDPATVAVVDGNIMLKVLVTGTRVAYGGSGFGSCSGLEWELKAKGVDATISPTDGGVSVSLTSPGGYTLTAVLLKTG